MVNGENGVILKSPKSESGIRDIRLGNDVMSVLKEARLQYMTDAFTYGVGFQNLGFVIRQEDGSPFKPDSMTQKWERFLKTHSLPKIRLHDLRHSCASLLIAQGVDIKVIQEWLGHSSIATTGNIYGHLQFKQKIETGAILENLLEK